MYKHYVFVVLLGMCFINHTMEINQVNHTFFGHKLCTTLPSEQQTPQYIIAFNVQTFRDYAKKYNIFETLNSSTTRIGSVINHFYVHNESVIPIIYREATRVLLHEAQQLPHCDTPAYLQIQEYAKRSLIPYVSKNNSARETILKIITKTWLEVIKNDIDKQKWQDWIQSCICNIRSSISDEEHNSP